MVERASFSRRAFHGFNYTFMVVISLICLFPLIHMFAISLSSNSAVSAGSVTLWPVDFTLKSYEYVASKPEFLTSFMVTLKRVVLGVTLNMVLTVLAAYPLSKDSRVFSLRTFFVWFFVITMLFHGGLIPSYLIVKETGLINTIWALVLPSAVPVFNVVLLLNFFRNLPRELEESAFMDGAGHWTTLWKIYVPLSLPAMATITL
ncbi:MAG: carbohydrate transporter permease, partial [Paenibacillus sp.]|nr:carbohydrate transporter permease [Paenibacillus sp.]